MDIIIEDENGEKITLFPEDQEKVSDLLKEYGCADKFDDFIKGLRIELNEQDGASYWDRSDQGLVCESEYLGKLINHQVVLYLNCYDFECPEDKYVDMDIVIDEGTTTLTLPFDLGRAGEEIYHDLKINNNSIYTIEVDQYQELESRVAVYLWCKRNINDSNLDEYAPGYKKKIEELKNTSAKGGSFSGEVLYYQDDQYAGETGMDWIRFDVKRTENGEYTLCAISLNVQYPEDDF